MSSKGYTTSPVDYHKFNLVFPFPLFFILFLFVVIVIIPYSF